MRTTLIHRKKNGGSSFGTGPRHQPKMKPESPQSAESQPLSSTQTTAEDVVASSSGVTAPNYFTTLIVAALYVLSGSTQPLLITLVKSAGLGDPHCQVYMLMY